MNKSDARLVNWVNGRDLYRAAKDEAKREIVRVVSGLQGMGHDVTVELYARQVVSDSKARAQQMRVFGLESDPEKEVTQIGWWAAGIELAG